MSKYDETNNDSRPTSPSPSQEDEDDVPNNYEIDVLCDHSFEDDHDPYADSEPDSDDSELDDDWDKKAIPIGFDPDEIEGMEDGDEELHHDC
jgi:hypothetical protein